MRHRGQASALDVAPAVLRAFAYGVDERGHAVVGRVVCRAPRRRRDRESKVGASAATPTLLTRSGARRLGMESCTGRARDSPEAAVQAGAMMRRLWCRTRKVRLPAAGARAGQGLLLLLANDHKWAMAAMLLILFLGSATAGILALLASYRRRDRVPRLRFLHHDATPSALSAELSATARPHL